MTSELFKLHTENFRDKLIALIQTAEPDYFEKNVACIIKKLPNDLNDDIDMNIFLDIDLFKLFKLILQSTKKFRGEVQTAVLQLLLYIVFHQIELKDQLLTLMHETDLISEFVQMIKSDDLDLQSLSLSFIAHLLKIEGAKECIPAVIETTILAEVNNIFCANPVLSYRNAKSIITILLHIYGDNEHLDFEQILNIMQTFIFFENNSETRLSLCLFVGFICRDRIKCNEFVLSEPNTKKLKKYFVDKAKYDKLIFDKTLQKYISNESESAIPIVIQMLIEQYYTMHTVKKVDKMEFDLLKRFVDLVNLQKYTLTTLNCALPLICHLTAVDEPNVQIFQKLIDCEVLEVIHDIIVDIEKLMDVCSHHVCRFTGAAWQILYHFMITGGPEEFEGMLPTVVCYAQQIEFFRIRNVFCNDEDNGVIASRVFYALFETLRIANQEHTEYLKDMGMIWILCGSFVDCILYMPQSEYDDLFRDFRYIIGKVLSFEDDDTELRRSIKKVLQTFDATKASEDSKKILDMAIAFISKTDKSNDN